MPPVDVSIILVSYNTVEMTLRAIASVFEQTACNFELIMVDNDSKDGSCEAVAEKFPQVKLICQSDNVGFARAVNTGVAQAAGEYVLLLNPDTVVLDGAIDALLKYAKQTPEAGIWGGVTYNNDMTLNPNNARAFISTSTLLFMALGLSKLFRGSCLFNHDNYGCWDRKSARKVDVVTGCFFLTPKALWQKLGGLDGNFFMYAEEADYCLRATQLGYHAEVTPAAKIIHHGGGSEPEFAGKMMRLLKGKVTFINKHSSGLKNSLHKRLLLLHIQNKLLQHRLLKHRSELKNQQYQEWRSIYAQRDEWLQGYPSL